MFLNLMFLFYFFSAVIFALFGKIEGRRLDEPKYMCFVLTPLLLTLSACSTWLIIGHHDTMINVLLALLLTALASIAIGRSAPEL
jgi:hypothetical protein